jgi:hypothetical protein
VIGLSEVRWPEKHKIVLGTYTMFYLDGVQAEKGVLVVLRNDIVKV